MFYFPAFLQQDIETRIKGPDSSAVLFGIGRNEVPDLDGFSSVKINPRFIAGQRDGMDVHVKAIISFNLSTNGKLEFSNTVCKENNLHRYENKAKVEIHSGVQTHNYEIRLEAIKTNFWVTRYKREFYALICTDERYPEMYLFAIVSEDWVERYKLPDLDSK